MNCILRFTAAISFLLSAVQTAHAQGLTSPDSSRSVVLRQALNGNWHVRLASAHDTVDGRVLRFDSETVRLVGSDISLPGIERIDRLRKHGGGTVSGGLIGGLGVGLLGAALSGLCDDGCDWMWSHAYIPGAVLGGVGGAVIGSLVAPPRRTWQPIWP